MVWSPTNWLFQTCITAPEPLGCEHHMVGALLLVWGIVLYFLRLNMTVLGALEVGNVRYHQIGLLPVHDI